MFTLTTILLLNGSFAWMIVEYAFFSQPRPSWCAVASMLPVALPDALYSVVLQGPVTAAPAVSVVVYCDAGMTRFWYVPATPMKRKAL